MKPRITLLTAGLLFTAAALAACRREVPAPLPGQDGRPAVQATGFALVTATGRWLPG